MLTPQAHNQYLRYEVGTSVVQVLSPNGGGGTGFAVQGDSGTEYIMTNKHVCEVADKGWLIVKPSNGDTLFKRVLYKDNKHDLCLIEGDKRLAPLEIGNSLYKGESMYIVGHPGLRQLTVSEGEFIGYHITKLLDQVEEREQCRGDIIELSPLEQYLYGMEFACIRSYQSYATTAVAYGGNSGSPVVNKWGNVIGVLFAGNPSQNTDNSVVPVSEVKRVLSKF
jgi:S1-C subfamily serine protease